MTETLSRVELRALRAGIEEFNTDYARVLDAGEIERWPDFFTENGFYRITARENHDAGLPVGLVWCEGRAMMLDRAAAIRNTMVYAPRYLRHYVTNTRVTGIDGNGAIEAESNYLVLETLMEGDSHILQAGRYLDRFVHRDDGLLLAARDCVYDTLLIPNDLVYPV